MRSLLRRLRDKPTADLQENLPYLRNPRHLARYMSFGAMEDRSTFAAYAKATLRSWGFETSQCFSCTSLLVTKLVGFSVMIGMQLMMVMDEHGDCEDEDSR